MEGAKLPWAIVGLLGLLVVGVVAFVMLKGVSFDGTQRGVETAASAGSSAGTPSQPDGSGSRTAGTSFIVPGGSKSPSGRRELPDVPDTTPDAAAGTATWKPTRHVARYEWIEDIALEQLNLTRRRMEENKDFFDDLGRVYEKHGEIIDVIVACREEARQAADIDDPYADIPQPAADARERMRAKELVYLVETMRALEKLRPRLTEDEVRSLERTISELYYRYEALKRQEQ